MKKNILLILGFFFILLLVEIILLIYDPVNKAFIDALVVTISLLLIVDLSLLGIGFASYSLIFIYLPIVSLGIYGPLHLVQPVLNGPTGYIDRYFLFLFTGLIYFFFVWSILLVKRHKGYSGFDNQMIKASLAIQTNSTGLITFIFAIISLACTFIFLPGLPGGNYRSVVPNLLPGNAWNAVALIAYFFVLFGKRSWFRNLTLILVPGWFLLHFHRVDVLGLFIVYFVLSIQKIKFKRISLSFLTKNWRSLSIVVIGFILLLYIGLIRKLGWHWSSQLFFSSLGGIFNYLTVQDVLYSNASAMAYVGKNGTVPTLLYYFFRLLPSQILPSQFSTNLDAAYIVSTFTNTNRGMLIIGEFYLNAKYIGILLSPFVTYLIIFGGTALFGKLFGEKGKGVSYFVLIISASRIFWYGFIYFIKPLLLISPFFIFLYLFLIYIKKRYRILKPDR